MKRLPSELNALKLRNRKKQIFTKLTEKIKTKEVYCQNTESSDIEKKMGYTNKKTTSVEENLGYGKMILNYNQLHQQDLVLWE